MENLGYYDGKYDLIENMYVPFDDRVHYFGDGVYDATCARNHIIFNLDEHIDRFYNSAGLLQINIPHTKEELKNLLNEMEKKVDGEIHFVYWQVTRGVAPRNHIFPDAPAKLWIMIRPAQIGDPSKRLKLMTVEDTRFLHCNIKTLNLIPNIMASQKGEVAGCDEIVFHRGDRVTECSHSNVSIIKDGIFITHPTDHYILPGIARAHLIKMCKKFGIPVDETPFTVKEMMEADEVIVSSSSNFCLSAYEIDGQRVGGKAPELLHKLQDALMEEFLEATNLKEA
ncbi:MAG: Branched-chain amino acid aminotransferase/4-amino-4-deoxychorismate lyase [Lachnoclostridium sp.]|jgi:D-alanine transaminase